MKRPAGAMAVAWMLTLSACGSTGRDAQIVSTEPISPASGNPSAGAATASPSSTSVPVAATPTTINGAGSNNDRLTWSDCPDAAGYQCATLSVPLDYATPSGKMISLALNRRSADDKATRIGALVVNPGGPGGSGLELAVNLAEELPADVLKRFDLVGFDPRGVGASTPVECISDAEKDRDVTLDDKPTTRADLDKLIDAQLGENAACATTVGDYLRHVSTVDAARDLDRIRQALGEDKLTYLGYSYGTRLGAVYTELFPGKIRALVLDGAVNPTTGLGSDDTGKRGFDDAFDRFALACRATPSCPAAPDPKALRDQLRDQTRAAPIASKADGRKMTPGVLDVAVNAVLYDQGSWPILAQGLVDAKAGDASLLFAMTDAYVGRDKDGSYSNEIDAYGAISCADDSERHSAQEVRADAAKITVFPVDPGVVDDLGNKLGCTGMPVAADPFTPVKASGAPPILVLGTTGDPATLVGNTTKLADALGSGVAVIWEGDGHTAFPKTPCITDLTVAYLVDLKVPAAGTRCPASAAGTTEVPVYKLDREPFRKLFEDALSTQAKSRKLGTCIATGLLAEWTDTELIHSLYQIADPGIGGKVDSVTKACLAKGR